MKIKNAFFFLVILFSFFVNIFLFKNVFAQEKAASIVINEFFPNPEGADKEGEFIELKNLSETEIDLTGWKLMDASGKIFVLKNEKIAGGGFLSLPYSLTKININNSDEKISLVSPANEIIFEISFSGSAKEGYSFGRFADADWRWTPVATPGQENYFSTPEDNLKEKEKNKEIKLDDLESKNMVEDFDNNEKNDDSSIQNVSSPKSVIILAIGVGLFVAIASIFFAKRFF